MEANISSEIKRLRNEELFNSQKLKESSKNYKAKFIQKSKDKRLSKLDCLTKSIGELSMSYDCDANEIKLLSKAEISDYLFKESSFTDKLLVYADSAKQCFKDLSVNVVEENYVSDVNFEKSAELRTKAAFNETILEAQLAGLDAQIEFLNGRSSIDTTDSVNIVKQSIKVETDVILKAIELMVSIDSVLSIREDFDAHYDALRQCDNWMERIVLQLREQLVRHKMLLDGLNRELVFHENVELALCDIGSVLDKLNSVDGKLSRMRDLLRSLEPPLANADDSMFTRMMSILVDVSSPASNSLICDKYSIQQSINTNTVSHGILLDEFSSNISDCIEHISNIAKNSTKFCDELPNHGSTNAKSWTLLNENNKIIRNDLKNTTDVFVSQLKALLSVVNMSAIEAQQST